MLIINVLPSSHFTVYRAVFTTQVRFVHRMNTNVFGLLAFLGCFKNNLPGLYRF